MLPLLAAIAAPAPVTGLPLRNDDVLSTALMLKVLLFTGLLLVGAYFLLRFYARYRNGPSSATEKESPPLQCRSALRLSTRTKVYLLQVGDTPVLVTESTSGSQTQVLSAVMPVAGKETS